MSASRQSQHVCWHNNMICCAFLPWGGCANMIRPDHPSPPPTLHNCAYLAGEGESSIAVMSGVAWPFRQDWSGVGSRPGMAPTHGILRLG